MAVLLLSGCMTGNQKGVPPPRVQVMPCRVLDIPEIRMVGELNSKNVADALVGSFVDDLKTKGGIYNKDTYVLDCKWGNEVGETPSYYYCSGKYKTPEVGEDSVISRFVWKEFKLGFDVDSKSISDYSAGVDHVQNVVYLKVKSVVVNCYVA
jgi:hypothetical protein